MTDYIKSKTDGANIYGGGNNSANHNAGLHFMPRMNAVFALDVASALRQINRQMATRYMVTPLWEGTLLLFNPWTHGFFISYLLLVHPY